MKYLFFLFPLFSIYLVNAQDNKTVTLVVSGQGKTQDEAKQNALRSAIEQAFGAFISSKTEILKEDIVKDEIVSVSNGNIQKFEILSHENMPNGDFITSLRATVSLTQLTSFVENKGITIDFKGAMFAFNVNQQMLNESNEITALKSLRTSLNQIADKSFDYKIYAKEPSSSQGNNSLFIVPISISCTANSNLGKWTNLFETSISALAMDQAEINNYLKINKNIYPFSIIKNFGKNYTPGKTQILTFRNEESIKLIKEIFAFLVHGIQNFEIDNGIEIKDLYSYKSPKPYNQRYNTPAKDSPIQQAVVNNYLMFTFNAVASNGTGAQDFVCYPCLYNSDKKYFGYNFYSSNGKEKNEISFTEISNLEGKLIANYEVNDELTVDQIRLITEYKVRPKLK